MYKRINFFAVLLAVAAVAIGCQKYDELPDPNANAIYALAPGAGDQDSQTKVSLTEDGIVTGQMNLAWQVDDEVAIADIKEPGFSSVYVVQSVNPTTGVAKLVKKSGRDLVDGIAYGAVYPNYNVATPQEWGSTPIGAQVQSADGNTDHLSINTRLVSEIFSTTSGNITFANYASMVTLNFIVDDIAELNDIVFMNGSMSYPITLNGRTAGAKTYTAHLMVDTDMTNNTREIKVMNGSKILFYRSTSANLAPGQNNIITVDGIPIYTLANISSTNVPDGDTWVIEDTDETANNISNFGGLKDALQSLDASRKVNVIFKNLTSLISYALESTAVNAQVTITAENVTEIGSATFAGFNATEFVLPAATTIGNAAFYGNTQKKITLATAGRFVSLGVNTFTEHTANIDLITHPSNAYYNRVIRPDGSYTNEFKSINGITAAPSSISFEGADIKLERNYFYGPHGDEQVIQMKVEGEYSASDITWTPSKSNVNANFRVDNTTSKVYISIPQMTIGETSNVYSWVADLPDGTSTTLYYIAGTRLGMAGANNEDDNYSPVSSTEADIIRGNDYRHFRSYYADTYDKAYLEYDSALGTPNNYATLPTSEWSMSAVYKGTENPAPVEFVILSDGKTIRLMKTGNSSIETITVTYKCGDLTQSFDMSLTPTIN